jgi:hypothetical protein
MVRGEAPHLDPSQGVDGIQNRTDRDERTPEPNEEFRTGEGIGKGADVAPRLKKGSGTPKERRQEGK